MTDERVQAAVAAAQYAASAAHYAALAAQAASVAAGASTSTNAPSAPTASYGYQPYPAPQQGTGPHPMTIPTFW